MKSGITLIALIITIIVLLILAGITISLVVGDNGVLNQAVNAADETNRANVQTELEMAVSTVVADWSGARYINGSNETLEDYMTIGRVESNMNTTDYNLKEFELNIDKGVAVGYKGKDYKFTVEITESGNSAKVIYESSEKEIIAKTVEDLQVGEKVYYDTGNINIGNKGIIECTILYDKAYNDEKETNYGIQIVSSDVIKSTEDFTETITLGAEDPTVIEGTSNFEKGMNSYNNAMKTLYNKAQEYLNTQYASAARCVGSNPANHTWDVIQNDAGYYTKEIAEIRNEYQSYMEPYYNKLKDEDEQYKIDFEQMSKIPELQKSSSNYWFASRDVRSGVDTTNFIMYFVFPDGELSSVNLCIIYSGGGLNGYGDSYGFRPVFTLEPGIKIVSGDGKNIPYTLSI